MWLSALLLSMVHLDIIICHHFSADNLSKAALSIQNSTLSNFIFSFTVKISRLPIKYGRGM